MVCSVFPRMKRLLLLALSAVVLSTLNGCAMSDEDKDFYGRGWIRPTDLDQPYPHHAGTPPGSAMDPATTTTTSTTSDPAHAGDSAWDVPGAPVRE